MTEREQGLFLPLGESLMGQLPVLVINLGLTRKPWTITDPFSQSVVQKAAEVYEDYCLFMPWQEPGTTVMESGLLGERIINLIWFWLAVPKDR